MKYFFSFQNFDLTNSYILLNFFIKQQQKIIKNYFLNDSTF